MVTNQTPIKQFNELLHNQEPLQLATDLLEVLQMANYSSLETEQSREAKGSQIAIIKTLISIEKEKRKE